MSDDTEQGGPKVTRFKMLQAAFGELIATFNEREKKSTIAIMQILPALADYLETPEEARIYAPPSEGLYPQQRYSALRAAERMPDNTWGGNLLVDLGAGSRVGFTIGVDFDEALSTAEFWLYGADPERRFRIGDLQSAEPFFSYIYDLAIEMSKAAIMGGAKYPPKRPIGFIIPDATKAAMDQRDRWSRTAEKKPPHEHPALSQQPRSSRDDLSLS
jgi:hypothetical protein